MLRGPWVCSYTLVLFLKLLIIYEQEPSVCTLQGALQILRSLLGGAGQALNPWQVQGAEPGVVCRCAPQYVQPTRETVLGHAVR